MGRFEITLKGENLKKKIKAELFITKKEKLIIGRTFSNKTEERKGTLIGEFRKETLIIGFFKKGLKGGPIEFPIPNRGIFNQIEREDVQAVIFNSLHERVTLKIKKSNQSAVVAESSFEELKDELLKNLMADGEEEMVDKLMALGKL